MEYTQTLRTTSSYDVVVCGGGPAGFPAALAAARKGMKVLLVEAAHQLGGTGTAGLVSHWLGGRSNDGSWVVGGIFREVSEAAAERNIAVIPDPSDYADVKYAPYGIHKGQLTAGIPFDPFLMPSYLEGLLRDAGVELLYETWVVDVIRDGEAISHVVIAGKDGLRMVPAKAFVDATGDADVAAHAGCDYVYGDGEGHQMAISLMIHLEGVDESELMRYVTEEDDPRFKKMLARLRSDGVDCYDHIIIIFVKMTRTGYFMINGMALPQVLGTVPESRTEAYLIQRAKVLGSVELFRKYWPGCRDITLRAIASRLGVRESRRIRAEGYLSVDDVLEAKTFPDTIGFTAYPWDVSRGAGDRDPHSLSKPPVIPIPYSVMVPKGASNLICPGRAIGCERLVLGPMRVQAPIMAMGQAAGTAASMAVESKSRFSEVDFDGLRGTLAEDGAIVG